MGTTFSWVWSGIPSHAQTWQDMAEVLIGDMASYVV